MLSMLANATPFSLSSTLFLGDLSIFCKEHDIYGLFQPYGPIERIEIKRSEDLKPHLSYGFIKFQFIRSAELALEQVNGKLFMGRFIRVNWAVDKSAGLDLKAVKNTAQIHVSFNSRNRSFLVCEASLRELFIRFGDILDVTINKTSFDQVSDLLCLSFSLLLSLINLSYLSP